MYAVAGVSGNVGRAAARSLLQSKRSVRALVRDPVKGDEWVSRGADVVVTDLADSRTLAAAFEGVYAAFVLNPPAYRDPDLFARAEQLARSIRDATREAKVPRLVVLSSIAAQIPDGTGNVRSNHLFDEILSSAAEEVVYVRPAYFMQNWGWVAAVAAQAGVLPSFLAPPERAIPMVSTEDVGELVAEALVATPPDAPEDGPYRFVELEGPSPVSPAGVASAFSRALGRAVECVTVPESEWPRELEKAQFAPRTIDAWIELFRAFNSGRIRFERPEATRRGPTTIEDAAAAIVASR